jgi:hypothetical protein
MLKEIDLPKSEIEPLAEGLANVFFQRHDLYARQMEDGSYLCIRKPLKTWHLKQHLAGELTLGAYVLDADSQANYIVIDADDKSELVTLAFMAAQLAEDDVPSYLETSRRGGHLWLFFERSVTGQQARTFGLGLLQKFGLEGIELFPKQTKLQNGPGSLIRLPFGVHRKSGERYGFITFDGHPLAPTLAAQVQLLSSPQNVPLAALQDYQQHAAKRPGKPVFQPVETSEGTLSQRIKASVTVLDFVSQYVELAPNGRGRCPFHDDHHASFSVNADQNYWHCFSGCGGGSIIDFWMKHKDCDFTAAVRELAGMLLK